MYMDSKKHTGSTGAPAKLSRKVRGAWQAHVSVLIMTFEKAPGGTVVEIVHVGVPQDDQKGARNGWPKYYWKPWKKYLARQKKK
jgi:hypothetical protein